MEYMVPTAFVVLPAMPLTPNGKIDRKALPAPDAVAEAEAPAGGGEAVDDNIEQTISAIWCEVLKVPKVGPRDNFFDLGGHSLLMVHVLNRLRPKVTGRELSMTDMFRYPTVSGLATFLRGASGAAGALDKVQERAAQRRERMRGGRGRPAGDET
jgi:acyl carrier protein